MKNRFQVSREHSRSTATGTSGAPATTASCSTTTRSPARFERHPDLRLPSELGREFKAVLDAMVLGPDGLLYGGTSDGFVFRFDTESLKITNLGKPMWQYRIRGLAFSKTGDLYGVGGERGGAARLFVYRTSEGGYENLGLLDVNRSPYYAWLAFEVDSMVAGPDGTIFIGESGRRSHLYLLFPW